MISTIQVCFALSWQKLQFWAPKVPMDLGCSYPTPFMSWFLTPLKQLVSNNRNKYFQQLNIYSREKWWHWTEKHQRRKFRKNAQNSSVSSSYILCKCIQHENSGECERLAQGCVECLKTWRTFCTGQYMSFW